MKTLFSLLLPVGFASLMALPFNIEIAGSIVFAVGFMLLVRADYGRRPKLLTPALATRKDPESLRLAA